LVEVAPRDEPAEALLDTLEAAVDEPLLDVTRDHAITCDGRHLRDAAPHRPRADDADGIDLVEVHGNSWTGQPVSVPPGREIYLF